MSAKDLFAPRCVPSLFLPPWTCVVVEGVFAELSGEAAGVVSPELAVAPISRSPSPEVHVDMFLRALPCQLIGKFISDIFGVSPDPDDAHVVHQPRAFPEVHQDVPDHRVRVGPRAAANDVDGISGVGMG